MNLNEMKDYKFYRIATNINGKIFLEFQDSWHKSIYLKHSVIKNKGLSIYYDITLYEIFKTKNDINKYIINY